MLDLTDGRVGLNLHVKEVGPGGETVKRVCDLLRQYAMSRIAYIAGDEDVLEVARSYDPELPRACLARQDDPPTQIAIAQRYDCQRLQFFRPVTEEQIQQARDVGLICNLFWSDDPAEAMDFVGQGIDVVLTNAAQQLAGAGFPNLRWDHASPSLS